MLLLGPCGGYFCDERGTPIGDFDVLIAAHAASLPCTLVTNNVRHCAKVPGLAVENWKQQLVENRRSYGAQYLNQSTSSTASSAG